MAETAPGFAVITIPSIRRMLPVVIAAALSCSHAIVARAADQPTTAPSTLTIEEAIDIAKRCVLERDIVLTGSFIESARFERKSRGDRGPYWVITWAWSREVKGGQVFVSVFQSRACDVTNGR